MSSRGFTLIELLIVMSIISILSAIAVPNFLETQTRAKVVRMRSDMRSVAIALEAYRVDTNNYPPAVSLADPSKEVRTDTCPIYEGVLPPTLTTPIGYIDECPIDIFPAKADYPGENGPRVFHYLERRTTTQRNLPNYLEEQREAVLGDSAPVDFYLLSVGPDRDHDRQRNSTGDQAVTLYDPTNGTVSSGDIYYFQGGGLK